MFPSICSNEACAAILNIEIRQNCQALVFFSEKRFTRLAAYVYFLEKKRQYALSIYIAKDGKQLKQTEKSAA